MIVVITVLILIITIIMVICRGCYDVIYIYVITALIFVYRRKIEERDDDNGQS